VLEITGLEAGYGGIPVLRDVELRVNAGEFVAIVGPNGAGKSTLFKTVSGIVAARSGSIRFEGADLLAVPPAARPHLGLAHVPEGRQVFPSLTVLENLEMGAYTETGRRAWKENLEKIHAWFPVLAERSKAAAGSLSGGQQQMLAIARGLASSPKLLLLDEPSMGLAGRPGGTAGGTARGRGIALCRSWLRPRSRAHRPPRRASSVEERRPGAASVSGHVVKTRTEEGRT
jgi:branched-chain amino acid transport system ATP-binding protein